MATMTSQQYRDYQARTRGSYQLTPHDFAKAVGGPVLEESDLHNAIIDYCREKGWQYLHGSMAHKTRRVFGEPDFIILAHGSQLRMIECKSKKGKLSQDQQAFIAHARKNGHVVYVVRSMEEFERLFA